VAVGEHELARAYRAPEVVRGDRAGEWVPWARARLRPRRFTRP
jgi:hypothetical protein